MADLAEYREQSLDSWERFSANWDEEREFIWSFTEPVSQRLVEALAPSAGDTVLELAAGTGETGFLVGERVGPEGHVISTDFAPGMVEAARRRGDELGLETFEYRVLDAERMDLGDDSVDGAICRFGYMLMADPAAALSETRRVLREGGRLSFAVWGPPPENLWAAIPGMTLVELGHMPPPEPAAPGIFAMADPDRIRGLVTGAGFAEPRIEQVPLVWPAADAAMHWEKTMRIAAPISDAVNALEPGEREKVRAAVAERAEAQLAEGGLKGLVHVVAAE